MAEPDPDGFNKRTRVIIDATPPCPCVWAFHRTITQNINPSLRGKKNGPGTQRSTSCLDPVWTAGASVNSTHTRDRLTRLNALTLH